MVQETFIIAVGRLGGLRDHVRLRPWLYAVARNECRQGGPVSGIQIQNPDPLNLTISLSVRSLSAGQTTTVHVTMVDLLSSSKTLVVSPGGLTITVRASGLLG